MFSWLSNIYHGILDLPYLVVNLLIESLNGWIMILAALVSGILALLPSFPSIPTLNGEVLSGVAWFLPIAAMLGVFATFVAAFVIWLGVQVALRWGKAL